MEPLIKAISQCAAVDAIDVCVAKSIQHTAGCLLVSSHRLDWERDFASSCIPNRNVCPKVLILQELLWKPHSRTETFITVYAERSEAEGEEVAVLLVTGIVWSAINHLCAYLLKNNDEEQQHRRIPIFLSPLFKLNHFL